MSRQLVLACLVLLMSGCWGGNELGLVPVSGTITFSGGPPPAEGRITFSPTEVAPGKPRRPARGPFGTDGKFEAESFKPGDGLVPGTYKVGISCVKGPYSDMASKEEIEALSYVPADFEPPNLVIEEGSGSVTYDLDVPKK